MGSRCNIVATNTKKMCQNVDLMAEEQIKAILGFHCHVIKNKIANHSIQKVPNLGNKRR